MAEISINIRRARPDDMEGVYSVMWSTGYIQVFYGGKSFELARGELLGKLFAENVEVYIAEIACAAGPDCKNGRRIVGYTIFGPYVRYYAEKNLPETVEYQGKIYDLRGYAYSLGTGVHTDFRGQAIGPALRMHADNQARSSGYAGIVTDVDASNTPSLRAQEKAGLIKVAEIPDKKRKSGINTVWIKVF